MVFKINIGTATGKTIKLETEAPGLEGKELGQTIKGEDISPDLAGYEFEIKGASDKSGFTSMENVEGMNLKKVLLTYGKAMHKRVRKEGKFKITTPRPAGLRLRKTVRGKIISTAVVQINLKLIKEGSKKLKEIYPEQFPEAPAEEKTPAQETAPTETPKEESKPKDKINPEKEPETEKPAEDLTQPEKEPAASEKDKAEATNPEEEPKE
ncbi:hypothetical protein HN832_05045 [archaeon]|jgi:small subunit ribosomal protein S6e|nr:hypothetical protein [archaeon]MBT4373730.1 hypothetical protein [archaeon]MBT4532307.1 hypothetical protein [archaeon]MBT7001943.1 hypothetical protein [archaeon]MBT7282752.1 hypothetical protein [archaeon]